MGLKQNDNKLKYHLRLKKRTEKLALDGIFFQIFSLKFIKEK